MDKKKIFSFVVLGIGIIMLGIGAAFLIVKLTQEPATPDAEYLVSRRIWTLESEDNCFKDETVTIDDTTRPCIPSVVWEFTGLGEGTLTINNHINDYGFKWALQDGKLSIQTDWLYELNNTYDYKLDQESGVLMLTDGDQNYEFLASED